MTVDRTALDASVIVAGLAQWHPAHQRARVALDDLLAQEDKPILPAHALWEAYSVLTRVPMPRRISPATAIEALQSTLEGETELAEDDNDQAWSSLASFAAKGIAGGGIYDARICATAVAHGATRILTLNRKHFERFELPGLEVWVP